MVQVAHEGDEYRKQGEGDDANERIADVEDEKPKKRQREADQGHHTVGLYFGADADSDEDETEEGDEGSIARFIPKKVAGKEDDH